VGVAFNDPNREAVGLAPIWGGPSRDNVANAKGATAGIPGTFTPAGADAPLDLAEAVSWGVVASPATAWTTGQYVQTRTAGAPGRMTWTGTAWVGGVAP
jgi:hypothetical protein